MQFHIATSAPETVSADALAVICFQLPGAADAPAEQTGNAAEVEVQAPDPAITHVRNWLPQLRSSGEFKGGLFDIAVLHRHESLAAGRLVVIGGGNKDTFTDATLRRVVAALARNLKGKGVRHLALLLDSSDPSTQTVAAVEGAVLGIWEANKYKSDPKKSSEQLDAFTVIVPGGNAVALGKAVETARVIGEAQNFARDLVNEPANKLSPAVLADEARRAAARVGLGFELLDREAMAKLGMGALLGVAQGSSNPPFLIVLKYRPSVNREGDHLALIGKGVTFDTGGISIKPSDGMEKMKYDMAGAAAVLGAMQAIAHLKPTIPVTGYIPTVENMVNGEAQRPGDIVTSLSGKTIEVINTDAEGRLILADAITYANRNGATHIVDAATLTGAIGIALGHLYMGAFTNNQPLLTRLLDAARVAGEKAWQLPLEEEYKELYLKSAFADLPNVGGRYGGSITAAWFLKEFADPTPWVHLDIASTAWLDDGKPWMSKGPTGVALRTFVHLALNWRTA
jgi:leucyl aminopeptidase